jgi:translation initiation factor 2 alpha subunit (eIF-2alpha)
MNIPSTIDVICPCCQTRLTIDLGLKAVIDHESAAKNTPNMNLQEALGTLKSEANRREAQFQQALAAEKEKGKVLERKFEEFLKKAKEDRSPPTPRPIDLD